MYTNKQKTENFQAVPDYPDYFVSDQGRVFSTKKGKMKELKYKVNGSGYYYVFLYREGKVKVFKIHHLVTMCFMNHVPNGLKGLVVDHINSDKLDNRLENLRLVTVRENASKLSEKKDKSSKYIGVSLYAPVAKWRAQIRENGKVKMLGYFMSEEEAAVAYQEALSKLLESTTI